MPLLRQLVAAQVQSHALRVCTTENIIKNHAMPLLRQFVAAQVQSCASPFWVFGGRCDTSTGLLVNTSVFYCQCSANAAFQFVNLVTSVV
jgi:hypothetical protein